MGASSSSKGLLLFRGPPAFSDVSRVLTGSFFPSDALLFPVNWALASDLNLRKAFCVASVSESSWELHPLFWEGPEHGRLPMTVQASGFASCSSFATLVFFL